MIVNLHAQVDYFFFKDTATTDIYALSLHDALPFFARCQAEARALRRAANAAPPAAVSATPPRTYGRVLPSCSAALPSPERESTRLKHRLANISYAVFCI